MTRWRDAFLLAAAVCLLAALASATLVPAGPDAAATPGQQRWALWLSLSTEMRLTYIRELLVLRNAENGEQRLNAARMFNRMDSRQQERLRTVDAALRQLRNQLSPLEWHDVNALPPAAQAVSLYHRLEPKYADALDRLATQLRDPSDPTPGRVRRR